MDRSTMNSNTTEGIWMFQNCDKIFIMFTGIIHTFSQFHFRHFLIPILSLEIDIPAFSWMSKWKYKYCTVKDQYEIMEELRKERRGKAKIHFIVANSKSNNNDYLIQILVQHTICKLVFLIYINLAWINFIVLQELDRTGPNSELPCIYRYTPCSITDMVCTM